MQPVLEYLPRNSGESFVTRYFDYHYYPTPWHFHPEYELVLVTESTGKRFIGDQVSRFAPGDLVLLGPYLPHTYQNDAEYLVEQSALRAKSIVVHFREDTFGENFFNLPETKKITSLLARSGKGLEISGKTNTVISQKLHELVNAKAMQRWLLLVEILDRLSISNEIQPICSNIITGQNKTETSRMTRVLDFVNKNYNREISLTEVAALANMAENSFSRYFSQRTRKSFTAYVNEVRLSHASKMLIETGKSVTDISFESGFNNLSNFNRQFRLIYHNNPVSYRKLYQNQAVK
jgi:AraC-like DNA-binding protein